jgi:hypothetical protein
MLSKTFDSDRFGVGGHLPTSPQDMASKRALDPQKWAKSSKNQANNNSNLYNKVENPRFGKNYHTIPLSLGSWSYGCAMCPALKPHAP